MRKKVPLGKKTVWGVYVVFFCLFVCLWTFVGFCFVLFVLGFFVVSVGRVVCLFVSNFLVFF